MSLELNAVQTLPNGVKWVPYDASLDNSLSKNYTHPLNMKETENEGLEPSLHERRDRKAFMWVDGHPTGTWNDWWKLFAECDNLFAMALTENAVRPGKWSKFAMLQAMQEKGHMPHGCSP